eukprot:1371341-Amorphochlora_amoeboformis.AAC.1
MIIPIQIVENRIVVSFAILRSGLTLIGKVSTSMRRRVSISYRLHQGGVTVYKRAERILEVDLGRGLRPQEWRFFLMVWGAKVKREAFVYRVLGDWGLGRIAW